MRDAIWLCKVTYRKPSGGKNPTVTGKGRGGPTHFILILVEVPSSFLIDSLASIPILLASLPFVISLAPGN